MNNISLKTSELNVVISVNDADNNYKISIRLNDECKNGHEDFGITASFWEVGRYRVNRNMVSAGCYHDKILAVRPDLKPFVDLHLCDWQGAPMYAKVNGFFNIKRYEMADFCRYFNCTPPEWDTLRAAEDEEHFWYLLTVSEIPARWKASALAATALLEKMAGGEVVFESKAVRSHFVPMSGEQVEAMRKKVEEGFYDAEALKERVDERKREVLRKRLETIEKRCSDEELKARKERDVLLFVVNVTGSVSDNVIYYNHTDELCFNWKSWGEKFTDEQIETVKARIGELGFTVTVTVGK